MDGNLLTIEGEQIAETNDEKDGYARTERFTGKFFRTDRS